MRIRVGEYLMELGIPVRRNYCMAFDNLCKKYEEAGKTFWSAERWRIQNKPSYVFMNHNLWRNHGSSYNSEG